jgi:hypothetical protein
VLARVGGGDEERGAPAEEGQELMLAKEGLFEKASGRMAKVEGAEVKERKAKGFRGRFRKGRRVEPLLGEERGAQGKALPLSLALGGGQRGFVEPALRLKACGYAALALAVHESLDLLTDRKG